jgi:hypothetical protein
MAAIVYPATLPVPQTSTVTPAERRALSDAQRPRQARALQRDRLDYERLTFPPMDADHSAIFRAWWKDTLIYGGAWFAAQWPLPRGFVTAVRKFREQPRWEFVPGGYWRVSALCEVRGAGELPTDGLVPMIYIGVEGNTYTVGPPVVTKINAATRAIVGQGDTQYLGAVARLGLISLDATQLFISVVNGVGNGTGVMEDSAPFAYTDASANSNWVFNCVFNPHSGVRCYTGYGAFVDLRGAVTASIDTTGYIEGTHLQSTRMAYRDGTDHVFLMNCGSAGIIRIDTLTAAVAVVAAVGDGSAKPVAMYYSPDTDRLFVDYRPDADTRTITIYDGESLAEISSTTVNHYPAAAGDPVGQELGNAIHLGGEVFIACESTSAPRSALWRVSFAEGASDMPSVFGSGCYCVRDPETGYIWTPWRSDGTTATPIGGTEVYDGAYALVYDPATLSLIDAIRLGDTGADFMFIATRNESSGGAA